MTFWPSRMKQNGRNLSSGTFWSNDRGLKFAHPSRDFAINLAERSLGGTDRSKKRQAFGPRGLKCCKFRGLETRNPASFESQLFECSLAKENTRNLQESQEFGDFAFPPNLAILDRARIRDDLPRENGQSPVLLFRTKRHENRSAKNLAESCALFEEKGTKTGRM